MSDYKKCSISKKLSNLGLIFTFIIILLQQIFRNELVASIFIMLSILSALLFKILSDKYDENKSKKQVKNTSIFAVIVYILVLVGYVMMFTSYRDNNLYIVIILFIVTTTYHIRDNKLKSKNPIDK
ncbi:MAG: hypothetical protein ACTHVE_07400 [Senegalia sp. (in: firmicutes)]|uniref:hypothetical protein n=1 Tax=Senegalia sp. (in: firmicutes) TaxID=1924098 RepID=UPI003F99B87A